LLFLKSDAKEANKTQMTKYSTKKYYTKYNFLFTILANKVFQKEKQLQNLL